MTIIPNLVQHLPPITLRHLHLILGNTIMTKIANLLPHNIRIQLYIMANACLINNPYPHRQYSYEQHDSFITPQPSQPSPHVGDSCTPPNTWVCALNSEEEASITDSEEDASIEDSREDVEDIELLLDDESDETKAYGGKSLF
ncbi:hypothetical protein ACB092_01G311800 [Castanea dentata]